MKYVHLTNNIVDFEMEAHPSNVFGSPYADDFVFTEDATVTTGWTFDGVGFTAPLPTPEPIPQSITPRQIRVQLTAIGKRQDIETIVASQSIDVQDWWEFSLEYRRDNELLISVASGLGITAEELDQFFIDAAKL